MFKGALQSIKHQQNNLHLNIVNDIWSIKYYLVLPNYLLSM